MYIQTEATPNPDTMKFLPGQAVTGDREPVELTQTEAAIISPLAEALFEAEGVTGVFLGRDFVSVTKSPEKDWKYVRPVLLAAIMDHYMAGLPVLQSGAAIGAGEISAQDETEYDEETLEIVNEIKELIETRVRPAVAQDGGDILFHRFEASTGIVHLSLRGACAGCPSSTYTLKQGIENMLRAYVPEVTAVEAAL